MYLTFDTDKVNIIKKDDNSYRIDVNKDISETELLSVLESIYNTECKEDFKETIFLNLRGLSIDLLACAIKYSLSREDLKDPVMILNIINMIKIYNNYDDSFFDSETNYFTIIDDFLDTKLLVRDELKQFSKKLSIYFISLFKSYNKYIYTPSDIKINLPNIYETIMLACDIMTLSGIFATSYNFDTKECVYITNGIPILTQLLTKHSLAMSFFEKFVEPIYTSEEKTNDNQEQ